MITILGFIGIITGTGIIGDIITKEDGIIHTIIALFSMTGVIIIITIIVSLMLQVYLKAMGEEEKR